MSFSFMCEASVSETEYPFSSAFKSSSLKIPSLILIKSQNSSLVTYIEIMENVHNLSLWDKTSSGIAALELVFNTVFV